MSSRPTAAEPVHAAPANGSAPRTSRAAKSRLFTADEIPQPPAEMRLPPSADDEQPSLFHTADADERDAD